MKKIFITLAIALGMMAMASCTSCNKGTTTDPVAVTELIYDVTAYAAGQGKFSWDATPHTGFVTLDGKLEVTATNDTTVNKVFTDANVANALTLAAGLASEDPETVFAAREVEKKLVTTTHLEGEYKLSVKGYAKYGPMYFIIDEEYPKPTAE